MPALPKLFSALLAGFVLAGAAGCQPTESVPSQASEPEPVGVFLARAEAELESAAEEGARLRWVRANFITYDTNWLVARNSARGTEASVRLAREAARYDHAEVDDAQARKLRHLKLRVTLPAEQGGDSARELAEIRTRMSTLYATGTVELDGRRVGRPDLEAMMSRPGDPARLKSIWVGWRRVMASTRDDYARAVELSNAGARSLGFDDVGAMWRSQFEMPPAEFLAEVDRLWNQVEPLYEALHCHVRAELNEEYGDERVPPDQPIRADLLGDMWAQGWSTLKPLIDAAGNETSYDLTARLATAEYTPERMVRNAEGLFVSLGFEPFPQSFYDRSLLTQPADRSVQCHASAWDLDARDDIRIKMCINVNAGDFRTIHHELGHNIYQRAYRNQDYLFRAGAHSGFHEAIGDMIALSVTPAYLQAIGLADDGQDGAHQEISLLLDRALDKIGFLPFGLLVDKWRWSVFSGEVAPAEYNSAWWVLREQYQGVRAPVPRPDDAFDPGSKYHIANHVPYVRYFLAHVMQFQFHRAACEMAGWDGPLHQCSVYGSKEVGRQLLAMLELGASRPWRETLQVFTGSPEMDASAIQAYFAPLSAWLAEQNAERVCGW